MADFNSLPPGVILPPEIIKRILIEERSRPRACVFELLVPDWDLCNCHKSPLESMVKLMRIDTYTKPTASKEGAITSEFEHPPEKCLYFPGVMNDYRGYTTMGRYYYRELLRAFATESTVVISQVKPQIGFLFPELPPLRPIVRDDRAITLLPYDARESNARYELFPLPGSNADRQTTKVPGSCKIPGPSEGEDSNPTYELIRHLVLNIPPQVLKTRNYDLGIWPPTESQLAACTDATERITFAFWDDRKAFFEIHWDRMNNLETLFLDLRDYSANNECSIDRRDVAGLSYALAGMNLKMLVIAGLRSYDLWPGTRPLTLEDIVDDELDLELDQHPRGIYPVIGGIDHDGVNWFAMFKEAVRPGGQLILVDRQMDRYAMPSWR